MRILLSIVLLVFVSVACKKEPIQYHFNGTVIENVNNSALSGAEVNIYQIPFDGGVATSSFEFVGSQMTNLSGEYEVFFEREKAIEFKIEANKNGYFDYELVISSDDVTTDGINTFDFTMDAKSWIKFDIINSGTTSASDELKLIFYDYREGCLNCAEEDFNYFYGEVDTTIKYISTAGKYFKFTYDDQDGSLNTTDSLYLTPFDTVSYSIIY